MWALVDCNSFFCSVEKVFHPGLKAKPVVVLSSNDGCIVALTPEAKKLGIKRGDPIFKIRAIVENNHVAVFSSNIQLYAAMSERISNILRGELSKVEKYSIDECFCDLTGYEKHYNLSEYMRAVACKIKLWTDIPVSVGIAPTKTLAKVGSKFAKQYGGYKGVCNIDTEQKRRKALALFPLEDVWGIGPQTLRKLNSYGVRTPLEFADKSEAWVSSHFTKPGLQSWMELNGVPCINTAEVLQNQTICTSRSFGEMLSSLQDLKAAVAHFASACAGKLRGQQSLCKRVSVFILSNPFRKDLPQYSSWAQTTLTVPSSDTFELTNAAFTALQEIFRPGIKYKKAGVILSDITNACEVQGYLFDPINNRPERHCLMEAVDSLNQYYGPKTIQLAVEGGKQQAWKVKCEHRSQNYLTNINELLTVG